ncbi:glycoside hydrolase family 1 protein [Rhodococcus maanshanensis]|uniref:Beta-glucosidase n=1 Tax=Rhodococcus maanshanensis TaxID=183556 RepID=A0A1H7I5N3_9NOCA|nr:family 1 glycosylhydrolase [Rhodococcus maanshanensis]SEK57728.1 beta-glucosidase [Rhodococcus maanshanensis]
MNLRDDFLWGAASSAHQTEGNNNAADWWGYENRSRPYFPERSGDAVDSYHRYPEDMALLADAGLNAYRFGIEWSRIEPEEGQFSRAQLDHYRRMIETARKVGLEPVVTLHHFTSPRWFSNRGGWRHPAAVESFSRYVDRASSVLGGVNWVCTINEPNIVALGVRYLDMTLDSRAASSRPANARLEPDNEIGDVLVRAHREAVEILRTTTTANVGWTVGQQAFEETAGNEDVLARTNEVWEDRYLAGARGDDFLGVQSYTSQRVGADGPIPHPEHPDNTLMGWAYRPDALGIALRRAWDITDHVPLLVTENGIATSDDTRRIAYTTEALTHLEDAVTDGIDIRGYLHWSALDNFEWGRWAPTFGLIGVDRATFARTPKPSLAWLGQVARNNGLSGLTAVQTIKVSTS